MLLNFFFIITLLIFLLPQSSTKCGDVIIDPGEECDDGNTQSNDGCNSDCRVEYDYKCSSQNRKNYSICYINKPFSAYLNYIPLTNPYEWNLTFTKPFMKYDPNLIKSLMNVSLYGLNSSKDFVWSLKNTSQETIFRIVIEFSVSFFGEKITVQFNNSQNEIVDIFNESLGSGSLILQADVPIYIKYSSPEENFMVFMKYFIQFVFIIMVFCFIPLSILNTLTVFWSFLGFI